MPPKIGAGEGGTRSCEYRGEIVLSNSDYWRALENREIDAKRTTTLGSVKNISSFGRDEDEKEDEEDEKVDSSTRRNPTSALTLACAIKTTFHSTLRIFRASCGHVDAWWP
ncbi:hypothetical protein HZH66_009661 [Vespula vulgaris]|uniref:Uncharacterized protein n=1 Tax=Vespula vulgaris TaxID=7454 RepID=A0A834JPF4_VESVU|nr:hypothetical protein HZH66_009661 [Vespula vulgaris]